MYSEELIIIREEDADLIHPNFSGEILYNPNLPSVAAYDWYNNTLVMGSESLGESDEVIRANMRHEKSHAIFFSLPAEQQRFVVNIIGASLQTSNLATFLDSLPEQYHSATYFAPPTPSELARMKQVGRGFKYDFTVQLHGRDIFLPSLVTEFLANLVESNQFSTVSARTVEIQGGADSSVAVAGRLYDRCVPHSSKETLTKWGLIRFDAFDELDRLKRIPEFQQDRLLANSITIRSVEDVE